MRILVTQTAGEQFGARVEAVAAGLELVSMQSDGSLRLPTGAPCEWDAADAEVAWATADLFGEGAPIRPFFGFIARAQSLRWIQSPAAGVDDPLFAGLVDRGVRLTSAHVNSIPIAEYVLRAALEHFQRATLWREAAEQRAWRRHDFQEAYGSTWLVIGVGSIGVEVASRARAFGARVIGVRRNPSGDEPVDEMIGPDGVNRVLPEADVVVLAAPATSQTRGMVDARFLAAMKAGALLVNVGRGSLVDEAALLTALDTGRPAAAVLDVFEQEPLPADHPFWSHPRITVTAHNAAGGTGRYGRAADLFVDNLSRYLRGEPLSNEVTRAHLD